MRDSEAIHVTTPRKAWDHPPPQASKTSGQKVAPRSATNDAVSWKARFRVSTSWKTSATEGEAEDREIPCFSEAGDASGDPDIGRAATSGRRDKGGDVVVGTSGIGWSRGEEEAAEQTTLRTTLWRKTLSPPQQQERA